MDNSNDINLLNKNVKDCLIYQLHDPCYNNKNLTFNIEKPLVFSDQQRSISPYPQLNFFNLQKFDRETAINEYSQIMNDVDHSKLSKNELSTRLRHYTTPNLILNNNEKIEQELLDKFNSVPNFNQNKLSKFNENSRLFQSHFKTLNSCKSTQINDTTLSQNFNQVFFSFNIKIFF